MICMICGQEKTTAGCRCDATAYSPGTIHIPFVTPAPILFGWVCPICGKGVSPWQPWCPCKKPYDTEVKEVR
jgi:hypothetical protein